MTELPFKWTGGSDVQLYSLYLCGLSKHVLFQESVMVKDEMLICLGGESWAVH